MTFGERIRRIILGPADDETFTEPGAADGPTPPTSTTPPATTGSAAGMFSIEEYARRQADPSLTEQPRTGDGDTGGDLPGRIRFASGGPVEPSEAARRATARAARLAAAPRTPYGAAAKNLPSYELRNLTPQQIEADLTTLAEHQALRTDIDTRPGRISSAGRQIAEDAGSRIPPVGKPYYIPSLDREPGTGGQAGGTLARHIPFPLNQPTSEGPAMPTTPAESGVHALDNTGINVPGINTNCTACGGTGIVTRPLNDLLRETVGWLAEGNPDDAVREFYRRLLAAAPDLAALFPADLINSPAYNTPGDQQPTGGGAHQRDRLLKALLTLSELYDPRNPASLDRLETGLRAFGRSHAAFARPDGTVRGATPEEYAAVKTVLFGTLADGLGAKFTAAHADAWSQAYDEAVDIMRDEQRLARRNAMFPRQPRAAVNNQES